MKKLILSLLCIASLSFATTFEDGVDAFESKDYKTALKVFEELGLKGDIESQYNVGIIYSNGYGIKEDKKKALEFGMNDHIAKPIDMNIVIQVLKKYI